MTTVSGARFVALALVVLCLAAGAAKAAQTDGAAPSNMELLLGAAEDATGAIADALPDSVDMVGLVVAPARATGVRVAIQSRLLAAGLQIASDPDRMPRLTIAIGEMSVTILETRRRWWVGQRDANRLASVGLVGELEVEDGLTAWTADATGERRDWLPASALAGAAGPPAYGCAPELPDDMRARIIGPTVAMSAIALVLYLFFTK